MLLAEKAAIRLIIFVVDYLFFLFKKNTCQYITSLIGYQK